MKLPLEIIDYIYSYDNTYYLEYKKCITELKQKEKKRDINFVIMVLSNGPNYIKPIYFKRGINVYPFLNIFDRNH